jgi:protease I
MAAARARGAGRAWARWLLWVSAPWRTSHLSSDRISRTPSCAPYDALREAGHEVELIGAKANETLKGKKGKESITTEAAAGDRKAASYDALVIPGGYSPDHLRAEDDVVAFVRGFVDSGKLVAAICHGPQLLIETDAVDGKRVTSWKSVKTDLENAGASWVDEEVVVDGALITSRKPDDLPAFTKAILERLPKARA